jgi:iron complex transport system substrate-binding protein
MKGRRLLCGLGWLLVAVQVLAEARAAPIKDVVVIGGALAEVVYALGAEGRIAGTDTTATYPAPARDTPKVGYQRSLSAEGVLSLKPSLVLATAEAGPATAVAQIRAAGVRWESMASTHSMDNVLDRVRRVARALDVTKAGDELAARLRREWSATQAQVAGYRDRPRVLFILAHAGPTPSVAGRDTAADAMIRLAGGVNAMDAVVGYKPLTSEAAVAAAPDVILTTREGLESLGGVDALLRRPGIALTAAAASRRVVSMEALLLLGFGPRTPAAVADLARAFRAGVKP